MVAGIAAEEFSRLFRAEDADFEDYDLTKPIVPQMEKFAGDAGIELGDGWKVDLARRVKRRLTNEPQNLASNPAWSKIFAAIEKAEPPKATKQKPASVELTH